LRVSVGGPRRDARERAYSQRPPRLHARAARRERAAPSGRRRDGRGKPDPHLHGVPPRLSGDRRWGAPLPADQLLGPRPRRLARGHAAPDGRESPARAVAGITVIGGGICGLAAGILLARDGHDVTVLERDAAARPDAADEAWTDWARPGVVQFRQPHFLQPRVRHVLDHELPDARDALIAADAAIVDPVERLPAAISDRAPRVGDDRF